MKQREKGMQDINDVTKKEGVNELSDNVLENAYGGYISGVFSGCPGFTLYDIDTKYLKEKLKLDLKPNVLYLRGKDISAEDYDRCMSALHDFWSND